MNESGAGGPAPKRSPKHYDVRVSVEQFGPIKKGSVDLRPLTIFVGPSNTGKTYLAILIYALHRTLHGFPRFPIMERYYYSLEEDASLPGDQMEQLLMKLGSSRERIRFSELPESMREFAQRFLGDEFFLADDLRGELERCFDLESVSSLIHMPGQDNAAQLSIQINDGEQELWDFFMNISTSGISSKGSIGDIEFLSDRNVRAARNYKRLADRLRARILNERTPPQGSRVGVHLAELWETLLPTLRTHQVESYYLPAARSGIMQSHRVIASSLVSRSTRAGFERFPELPTFSGVMADFMQRLILYDVPNPNFRIRRRRMQNQAMKSLAEALEQRTLAGKVRASRPSPGGYPEFVYRPAEVNQDIRLSRASSMVSELAPVVLFIRGNIDGGDTLIIEEPEAHLHPAAQTEMAATLAQLVRSGVRVVVTTHSDWLLKELGNLMREGEIEERSEESRNEVATRSSLRPQDVGIWLFEKDDAGHGSTIREIEFDRIEGIEPSDYETVAEQLYNRSADLQNRFEEVASQGKKQA